MAKQKEDLSWNEIDPDEMTPALKKLYAAFKEKSRAAGEARTAFNEAFGAALVKAGAVPEGKTPVIGHNFGKLSVAFSDATKAAKKAKGTLSIKFR